MRTIPLEEHFATPGFLDGPGRDLKEQARQIGGRAERLMCDLGEARIAQMDAAGIDMQVLSLTAPGLEQLEAAEAMALARDTNDALAASALRMAMRRHCSGSSCRCRQSSSSACASLLAARSRGQL